MKNVLSLSTRLIRQSCGSVVERGQLRLGYGSYLILVDSAKRGEGVVAVPRGGWLVRGVPTLITSERGVSNWTSEEVGRGARACSDEGSWEAGVAEGPADEKGR